MRAEHFDWLLKQLSHEYHRLNRDYEDLQVVHREAVGHQFAPVSSMLAVATAPPRPAQETQSSTFNEWSGPTRSSGYDSSDFAAPSPSTRLGSRRPSADLTEGQDVVHVKTGVSFTFSAATSPQSQNLRSFSTSKDEELPEYVSTGSMDSTTPHTSDPGEDLDKSQAGVVVPHTIVAPSTAPAQLPIAARGGGHCDEKRCDQVGHGISHRPSLMEDFTRKLVSTGVVVSKSSETRSKRLSVQAALNAAGIATAAESKWVINPERSYFLQKWDIITMLALCWVAVVVPVHVAMLDTNVDLFFMLSTGIDFIFLADLFLQFFIMYPKRTNFGYALESSHSNIVKHYVKTWLLVDIVSILPVDLVGLLTEDTDVKSMRAVKIIRLLRLLKLARLARAQRLLQRYEARTSVPYGKLALLKFFLILFLITHWLATLWALTLRLVDSDEGLPRWIDRLDERDENVDNKTKDTPWKLYIVCLYFTSYTITSVGYGDIGPENIVETITATIMIVVAGISWAVVLGQVCGIVSNLDSEEQVFRSRMDELNTMMEDRVIDPEVRTRLRSFFLSNKTAQRRARQKHIIASMSPGLRGEVALEINRRWMMKVSLLKHIIDGCSSPKKGPFYTAFLVEVSLKLTTCIYAQSETFGMNHTLCILLRGLVAQNDRIRQSGSVWGIDFCLTDPRLISNVDSFAMTYVEMMTLGRSVFMKLVEKHGRACPELRKCIRRMTCWLAFQRAIWWEAARRQAASNPNSPGRRRRRTGTHTFTPKLSPTEWQDEVVDSCTEDCIGHSLDFSKV